MKVVGLLRSGLQKATRWLEIRTKHLRASFETGFEAALKSIKPMEIEANNMTKKGALSLPVRLVLQIRC